MAPLPSGLNFILLVLVIIASLITILQTVRDTVSNSPRWIPISLGLICIALLAALIVPTIAGYLSAALWILVAIVPSIGFRLTNYYFYQGQYQRAYRLKWWLCWLHPLADWPWQNIVFQAYIALDQGERKRAATLLQEATAADATPEQRAFYFAMSHNWSGLLDWWNYHPQQEELRHSPGVLRYYLLALGENGEVDRLIETFIDMRPILEKVAMVLDYAHLYLFAFGGKVDETVTLLHSRFASNLNRDIAIVWIATAHYAADHPDLGRSLLQPLQRTTDDGVVKFAIEQRLETPIAPVAAHLSLPMAKELDAIAQDWLARTQLLAHWR